MLFWMLVEFLSNQVILLFIRFHKLVAKTDIHVFVCLLQARNYEKTVLKSIVLCLIIAKDSTWFMILQMDVEDLISFSEVSGERSVLRGKQLLSAMNTQWKLKWKCRTACFISQLFEKVLRGLIIFSVLILLLIYIKTLLGKKVS